MKDVHDLTDEFDKAVMESEVLTDEMKELLFNIVGDVDKATHLWSEFLREASRDAMAELIVNYEIYMTKYFNDVLDPLGIDYFDAPFIHHFYCRFLGIDLKEKYMKIGTLGKGEEE
tara:strand:+ start:112 stop:459 length:348 start_codon:yes stop_codon:yes gene_type:complete